MRLRGGTVDGISFEIRRSMGGSLATSFQSPARKTANC